MPKVLIAYSPDLSKIGKTVSVSDEEAEWMVREGRATLVTQAKVAPQARAKKVTAKKAAPTASAPEPKSD